MADVKKLAEELTKLTVLEVNELKNVLKDEYGIEAKLRLSSMAFQKLSLKRQLKKTLKTPRKLWKKLALQSNSFKTIRYYLPLGHALGVF
jgi:ribosomal protein L7/L12